MTNATRSTLPDRASDRMIRGRHLQSFDCVYCGPVEHGTALQVGEVLVCWLCLSNIVMGDPRQTGEADDCTACWPQTCVACGVLLLSGADHRSHVNNVHPPSTLTREG